MILNSFISKDPITATLIDYRGIDAQISVAVTV